MTQEDYTNPWLSGQPCEWCHRLIPDGMIHKCPVLAARLAQAYAEFKAGVTMAWTASPTTERSLWWLSTWFVVPVALAVGLAYALARGFQ